MTYAVRYYTKTGNTKKLAEAVAAALGVTANQSVSRLPKRWTCFFLAIPIMPLQSILR